MHGFCNRFRNRVGSLAWRSAQVAHALLLTCIASSATDLIYIDKNGSDGPEVRRIAEASDFEGLRLGVHHLQVRPGPAVQEALRAPDHRREAARFARREEFFFAAKNVVQQAPRLPPIRSQLFCVLNVFSKRHRPYPAP